MHRRKTRAVFIYCSSLCMVICLQSVCADEPNNNVRIPTGPVAAELTELGKEYSRLSNLQIQAEKAAGEGTADAAKFTDDTISDEEWLKRGNEIEAETIDPDVEMLPRLLDFAKRHPDSPYAFDAIFKVIHRGGPQTGNVHGIPWKLKEDALNVVWTSHAHGPRMFILLKQLSNSLPSQKTEAFLCHAMQHGPGKKLQAAAAYSLARYYQTLMRAHQQSQRIKQKERLLNFERYWKVIVTPYLEKEFPLNAEAITAETDRLLHLIGDKYADVQATDWKLLGPNRMFVELKPFPKPKTYGDMATAMSFELNNITSGKPAPEIDGIDVDGKRFRLSDYRGKVVLLTFTANWCGSCVALYPLQCKLVEKYRDSPFVLLSVSCDEKIDTLKAATALGKITWRCWWDGMDGPISNVWHSQQGFPRFILLDDKHVIQHVVLNRYSTLKEFEKPIDALLKNIPSTKSSMP